MNNLDTTPIGTFKFNTQSATAQQISAYVASALSAETVAIGGNDADHGDLNARATNYGVAVGYNAVGNLGLAFGADAYANGNNGHDNAMALGRYAYAEAAGAVQINGQKVGTEYQAKNTEAYTLKFYAGSHGNKTIVNANGQISADVAISCDGNATTATKLKTSVTIGGVAFDGSDSIDLPGVNTVGTQNTTGKANTAGIADSANALNSNATIVIGSVSYSLGTAVVLDKDGTTERTVLTLIPQT